MIPWIMASLPKRIVHNDLIRIFPKQQEGLNILCTFKTNIRDDRFSLFDHRMTPPFEIGTPTRRFWVTHVSYNDAGNGKLICREIFG